MDIRDTIRTRMLSAIDDSFDILEGSFFYDVINAVAIEFEEAYKEQNEILDKAFVDTSTGESLNRKVLEQGLTRKSPTIASGYVTITGQEGITIEEGLKVSSDASIYTVKETKIIGSTRSENVLIECSELGSIGNCPIGAINTFPVRIAGLTSVTNSEAIDNGYDEETDEELRERYLEKVRTPPTSGNKYHYRNWAKEVIGVGDARIVPLWNGNGTVKVIVIDANKTGAEQEIIDEVFNHIEENRPIGAQVTVISAAEVQINIGATLNIDSNNFTIDQVKTNIENTVKDYLKDIAFVEDYVSYAKIGSIIIASNGVIDYSDLTINNVTSNIQIGDEEIAVIGTITTS